MCGAAGHGCEMCMVMDDQCSDDGTRKQYLGQERRFFRKAGQSRVRAVILTLKSFQFWNCL